jgi:hypothetical protein
MKQKAKSNDKKVWVEVEVNKYTDGITVFRGMMQRADLESWSRGELIDSAIKLEKTYWFLDENICILGKGDDNARQYTGDTYLRSDTIMLIFVLKEDSYPTPNSQHNDNIFPFPGRSKQ